MAKVIKVGDVVMANDKYYFVDEVFEKDEKSCATVFEVSFNNNGGIKKGEKQIVEEIVKGKNVFIKPIKA